MCRASTSSYTAWCTCKQVTLQSSNPVKTIVPRTYSGIVGLVWHSVLHNMVQHIHVLVGLENVLQ